MKTRSFPVGQAITAVIILVILAVLVVPHLLRRKNEELVRAQMQSLSSLLGEAKPYPAALATDSPKTEPEHKLFDIVHAIERRGYEIDYAVHPSGQSFLMKAVPRRVGTDGNVMFQLDEDGIVSEVRVEKASGDRSGEGMFAFLRE